MKKKLTENCFYVYKLYIVLMNCVCKTTKRKVEFTKKKCARLKTKRTIYSIYMPMYNCFLFIYLYSIIFVLKYRWNNKLCFFKDILHVSKLLMLAERY